MYENCVERPERLTGRFPVNGLITRFTTNAGVWGAVLAGVFATLFASIDLSVSFFIIVFPVGFRFVLDFDVNFTTPDLTAAFDLIFDFSTITHILLWILETPSASFMFLQIHDRQHGIC